MFRGRQNSNGAGMMGCEKYGQYYWCVKTPLSGSGEIYVHADEARILPDGTLSLNRMDDGVVKYVNLAIAPGQWTALYAASVLDGAAVAVEHWEGEVSR
jgi:hypothetical protein